MMQVLLHERWQHLVHHYGMYTKCSKLHQQRPHTIGQNKRDARTEWFLFALPLHLVTVYYTPSSVVLRSIAPLWPSQVSRLIGIFLRAPACKLFQAQARTQTLFSSLAFPVRYQQKCRRQLETYFAPFRRQIRQHGLISSYIQHSCPCPPPTFRGVTVRLRHVQRRVRAYNMRRANPVATPCFR